MGGAIIYLFLCLQIRRNLKDTMKKNLIKQLTLYFTLFSTVLISSCGEDSDDLEGDNAAVLDKVLVDNFHGGIKYYNIHITTTNTNANIETRDRYYRVQQEVDDFNLPDAKDNIQYYNYQDHYEYTLFSFEPYWFTSVEDEESGISDPYFRFNVYDNEYKQNDEENSLKGSLPNSKHTITYVEIRYHSSWSKIRYDTYQSGSIEVVSKDSKYITLKMNKLKMYAEDEPKTSITLTGTLTFHRGN